MGTVAKFTNPIFSKSRSACQYMNGPKNRFLGRHRRRLAQSPERRRRVHGWNRILWEDFEAIFEGPTLTKTRQAHGGIKKLNGAQDAQE